MTDEKNYDFDTTKYQPLYSRVDWLYFKVSIQQEKAIGIDYIIGTKGAIDSWVRVENIRRFRVEVETKPLLWSHASREGNYWN